jgi:hypothetical protein
MLQSVDRSIVTDVLKLLHSNKISAYFYQLKFNIQEDFKSHQHNNGNLKLCVPTVDNATSMDDLYFSLLTEPSKKKN